MIVLDTSALLYWTLDPAELTLNAEKAIANADKVVVSSISLWEIALKVKRGKLVMPLTMVDYIGRLIRLAELEILPVDVQTWVDNVELDWDHHDLADRTIVALATRLECPLISSDNIITSYYPKTVW